MVLFGFSVRYDSDVISSLLKQYDIDILEKKRYLHGLLFQEIEPYNMRVGLCSLGKKNEFYFERGIEAERFLFPTTPEEDWQLEFEIRLEVRTRLLRDLDFWLDFLTSAVNCLGKAGIHRYYENSQIETRFSEISLAELDKDILLNLGENEALFIYRPKS